MNTNQNISGSNITMHDLFRNRRKKQQIQSKLGYGQIYWFCVTRLLMNDSEGGKKDIFYLTTHWTHFIYGYMASDIWERTIQIAREYTRCCHMGYSFWLAARVFYIHHPTERIAHITAYVTPVVELWLERDLACARARLYARMFYSNMKSYSHCYELGAPFPGPPVAQTKEGLWPSAHFHKHVNLCSPGADSGGARANSRQIHTPWSVGADLKQFNCEFFFLLNCMTVVTIKGHMMDSAHTILASNKKHKELAH